MRHENAGERQRCQGRPGHATATTSSKTTKSHGRIRSQSHPTGWVAYTSSDASSSTKWHPNLFQYPLVLFVLICFWCSPHQRQEPWLMGAWQLSISHAHCWQTPRLPALLGHPVSIRHQKFSCFGAAPVVDRLAAKGPAAKSTAQTRLPQARGWAPRRLASGPSGGSARGWAPRCVASGPSGGGARVLKRV